MKSLFHVLCLIVSFALIPTTSFAAEPISKDKSEVAIGKININTADAETIADNLKGIGIKKASAIITYREQLGGYKSLDQLLDVKGIGAKTLDKLRDQLVL
jgi:competence protein ComEA